MCRGAARHRRPQIIPKILYACMQEDHVGRAEERRTTCGQRKKGKDVTDSVAENRWVFGIMGEWSTTVPDPGAW